MIRVLVLLVLPVGSAGAQQSFSGPTTFSQGPTLSEKLGGAIRYGDVELHCHQ